MTSALLPINATDFEKELTDTVSSIGELPGEIDQLWNPQECPEEFLPWLAWALSVDNWNSDWPVEIKRAQIADSIEIHRRKGTVLSVKLAMEAFGVQVELKEWFEDNEEPHTFLLKVWADEHFKKAGIPLLSSEYYTALQKAVNVVKPARSHYQFKIGARYLQNLKAATAFSSVLSHRRDAEVEPPEIDAKSGLTATSLAHPFSLLRQWVQPPGFFKGQLQAPAIVLTQRTVTQVRVTMEI